jgi:hypothetical protein
MKLFHYVPALLFAQGVLSSIHGRWNGDNENNENQEDHQNQQHNAGCNADNCARAVTGTRPGKTPSVESRKIDCSSFQKITVIPATV